MIIIVNLSAKNHEQISEITSEMTDFFNLNQTIFLFDSSVDIDRFISARGYFTPQSLYVYQSDDDHISDLESVKKVMSRNTFRIVVPGTANYELNFYLLTRVKKIQRLQVDIGIFLSNFTSIEDLQQIINIFAATYSEDIQELNYGQSFNILEHLM